MILLDTDHLTVLKYIETERGENLLRRLTFAAAGGTVVGTTIVGVEEQMRGWLAAIAKERLPHRLIGPYRELGQLFEFFRKFYIAPFSEPAADHLATFGSIRIGMRDRKTASIALAHNALLLTANRRDFEQVPGLRFENWLEP